MSQENFKLSESENSTTPGQLLCKFGLFADVQYADKDPDVDKARFYRYKRPPQLSKTLAHWASIYMCRESNSKLSLAVEGFNSENVEFVVSLGDIIEGGANSANELEVLCNILKELRSPLHRVIGKMHSTSRRSPY